MPCAGQHLVLQCVHARRGLVDVPHERQRSLQDRLQLRSILNPRRRVFVLDDEMRVGNVERQQLSRGKLMIEPVNAAVLQIRQRIVSRGAWQFVLGQHDLFLPRVHLIGGPVRRLAIDPVTAPHRLAAVAPRGDALRIDHLALHVKAADEEAVAFVLQVLKDRARVLPHQDGVRRVVVNAELVADAVLLADRCSAIHAPGV